MENNNLRSYNILKKYKIISLINGIIILKDHGLNGVINKIKSKINKNRIIDDSENKINFLPSNILIVVDYNIEIKDILQQLSDIPFNIQIFKLTSLKNINNINEKYQNITYKNLKDFFVYKSFIYITKKAKLTDDYYFAFNVIYRDNLKNKIMKILNSIEGLKLFANYNSKNNITVKASTFFDYDGLNYYSGGAERYLIDLHELCSEKKINLDIYQNANIPFFRKYQNINVIGLSLKDLKIDYNKSQYFVKQSQNYKNVASSSSQLHIYSAFNECYPNCAHPSIGISHGVSWDHKFCKVNDGFNFWAEKQLFIESAILCDKLVSVDTNTANWFQTIDYEIGNKKFQVIPNYVNTKEFSPRKDYLKQNDRIIITYPRRLYEPRGLYLALDIANEILQKYNNVEFHFVGKGFDKDLQNINKLQKKWPKRLFCYSKNPNDMHEVYKMTDISLIPTLYSEGTSLSCLEAMASGNIVVATRIGGLTDLIINSYNGFLIEPNKKSLLETIEHIINNFSELNHIKQRAIETAEVFNKNIWKQRWSKLLDEFNLATGKSSNIDLVEFQIDNIDNIDDEMKKNIINELLNNRLVYIRCVNKPKTDQISGGLIQVVGNEDEIVSTPVKIYAANKKKRK